MDQTLKTCLLVALQRNPVESGKGLAMTMPNARALLNVENTIATLLPHLQITVAFKNLTAAIQVNMSIEKRYSAVLIHISNYFST